MRIRDPENNVEVFRPALEALNESGIPFVIGGAFAMYHYTGAWRNTHDLDVYLEHRFLPAAADCLSRAGFEDFGEMAAGDRSWIYHASKDGAIVDLIWEPPNHLDRVDGSYYARAQEGTFLGLQMRFLAADDLILAKLFTMNRHRCDWPDIFRVLKACPDGLDWQRIEQKAAGNWEVLLSLICLFDWTYPEAAGCVPEALRRALLERKLRHVPDPTVGTREELLDPWIYTRPPSE